MWRRSGRSLKAEVLIVDAAILAGGRGPVLTFLAGLIGEARPRAR